MHLWCENCREKTQALAGKYDINICNQCGCEVRGTHDQLIAMQTQGLMASLNLDDAMVDKLDLLFDGQSHDVSQNTEAPANEATETLTTAKFLSESFYDEEIDLADSVAMLDEAWPEDELIAKIQRLEDSLRPSGKTNPASAGPDFAGADSVGPDAENAGSKKVLRVDLGHVTAQRDRQIEANHPVAQPAGEQESKPLPMARKLGDVKSVRIDPVEIPVAQPTEEGNSRVTSQATSLGLVATWTVQLLVGIAFAPTLPAAVWGLWLFAQVAGSLCLCFVLFHLFAGEPKSRPFRKSPKPPVSNSIARSARLFQD